MKASISVLIALGVVSQPVWAQVQALPEPTPPSGISVQPDPPMAPSATDRQQPGMEPSSGTSASDTPAGQASGMGDPATGDGGAMQSEAGMELRAAAPPVFELKPVVQGDITYLCGGIGEEEAAFMKREAKDYDLMLTFAARSGAYLADVDVDIADARGNSVLQANCDAPIMLVDLPRSGNYRVRADADGYTLNRTVRVANARKGSAGVASASLVWPQRVAEGGDSAPAFTGDSATGGGAAGDGNGEENGRSDSSVDGGAR